MTRPPLLHIAATFLLVALTPAALFAEESHEHTQPLEEPVKEIMKVTDAGLVPSKVLFHKLDSSLFFVNASEDSLINVTVRFGSKQPHCASSNMKFEDGSMHSVKPIGPKDFAIMCFPEKGTYEVLVEGLASKPGKVIGQVVVE